MEEQSCLSCLSSVPMSELVGDESLTPISILQLTPVGKSILELATENWEHETSRCVTTNPFQAPQPSLLDLRDTVLGPWLSYAFTASGGRVIHSYVDSPSVACLLLFRN